MAKDKVQVIVIGGGASGLMAAVAAAREGAAVTLLESMTKPGRKLLMTGNGKCNMMMLDAGEAEAYRSFRETEEGRELILQVLRSFPVSGLLRFFEEIGVPAVARGTLIYPRSEEASSVLNALLSELVRLKVKMKYNAKAEEIRKDPVSGKWHVRSGGWTYEADRVILCCGSKAAPNTGSDGSGYELAKATGHAVTEIRPALTGLILKERAVTLASGARSSAKIWIEGMQEETGQIQWTDYGISGIAVFQLSRFLTPLFGEAGKCTGVRVLIDLAPDLTETEVCGIIRRMAVYRAYRETGKNLRSVFGAFMHERVAAMYSRLLEEEGADRPGAEEIAAIIKHRPLTVTGVRGFEHAQICAGGVDLSEVVPETLESRLTEGLFFAGELLDVDGPCGGYNLRWAFASGYAAGKAAACKGGLLPENN